MFRLGRYTFKRAETAAELEQIHERMCRQDADVVKIAVRAQRPTDNLRVLGLLKAPPKPTVALCMGDLGMPGRLLAARYGAPFTYAAFNRERTLAGISSSASWPCRTTSLTWRPWSPPSVSGPRPEARLWAGSSWSAAR